MMAKQTNQVAWGLAAVLVAVLLGGGSALLTHGIHVTRVEVGLVPVRSWCVASRTFTSCGQANRPFIVAKMVRSLFVDVTVHS
jgi:hypothetical protein